MLRAMLLAAASLMLISCASGTPQRTVEIQRQPVPVSEETLRLCQTPNAELKPGDPMWMVLSIWTDYTKAHQECVDRQRVLAGAVREHNDLAGTKANSGTN